MSITTGLLVREAQRLLQQGQVKDVLIRKSPRNKVEDIVVALEGVFHHIVYINSTLAYIYKEEDKKNVS